MEVGGRPAQEMICGHRCYNTSGLQAPVGWRFVQQSRSWVRLHRGETVKHPSLDEQHLWQSSHYNFQRLQVKTKSPRLLIPYINSLHNLVNGRGWVWQNLILSSYYIQKQLPPSPSSTCLRPWFPQPAVASSRFSSLPDNDINNNILTSVQQFQSNSWTHC